MVEHTPASPKMSASPSARFRHCNTYAVASVLAVLTISLIVFGVMAIIENLPGDLVGGMIVIFLAPFIGAITVNALLVGSDVLIDEEGLSRSIFGKVWQKILWRDVKKIRLMPMATFEIPRGRTATVFYVDQTDKPRMYFLKNGGIVFDEQVNDLSLLIALLNRYISFFNIPIYSGLKNPQRRLDRIRLADCLIASAKQDQK